MLYTMTISAKQFKIVLVECNRWIVYILRREMGLVVYDLSRSTTFHTEPFVSLEDKLSCLPPFFGGVKGTSELSHGLGHLCKKEKRPVLST